MSNKLTRSLIAAAASLALIGCGEIESKPDSVENAAPNSTNPECILDTDCTAGLVCEESFCVAECTFDADCSVGEVCGPRTNGTGTVCQPDTSVDNEGNVMTNNTEMGCSSQTEPNLFCEEQFGDNFFCDTGTDTCQSAGPEIYGVLIEDVTTDFEACEDVDDPGSDIQAVELQTFDGTSKGWGVLVYDDVVLDGNFEANFEVLDGSPNPALDQEGCVESFPGNVLALGCTGLIVVEFLDESGIEIPLAAGDQVVVYEYGGFCSTGTTDDTYLVSTCDDRNGVNVGDVSSCDNFLGEASGVAAFNVSF